jgi:hypothetical protein
MLTKARIRFYKENQSYYDFPQIDDMEKPKY